MRAAVYVLLVSLALVPAQAMDGAAEEPSLYSRQHQHRSDVRPMALAEMEATALANNPEIKVAARRVSLAEKVSRPRGTSVTPSSTTAHGERRSLAPGT